MAKYSKKKIKSISDAPSDFMEMLATMQVDMPGDEDEDDTIGSQYGRKMIGGIYET